MFVLFLVEKRIGVNITIDKDLKSSLLQYKRISDDYIKNKSLNSYDKWILDALYSHLLNSEELIKSNYRIYTKKNILRDLSSFIKGIEFLKNQSFDRALPVEGVKIFDFTNKSMLRLAKTLDINPLKPEEDEKKILRTESKLNHKGDTAVDELKKEVPPKKKRRKTKKKN